ncbi:MAG: S9 family peptidase, partial [Caldimonas sp.]
MTPSSEPRTTAPHGSWHSDVSAESLTRASPRLGQTAIDGDAICWTEGRPWEQGRNVLVRGDADGNVRDLTPVPWNVRSLS